MHVLQTKKQVQRGKITSWGHTAISRELSAEELGLLTLSPELAPWAICLSCGQPLGWDGVVTLSSHAAFTQQMDNQLCGSVERRVWGEGKKT